MNERPLIPGNSMVVTAFVPLHSAGEMNTFNFSCGACLSLAPNVDFDLYLAKLRLVTNDWVSRNELSAIDRASACIYLKTEFVFTTTDGFLHRAYEAAQKIDTLLWCIDLAGCGENNYWSYAGRENFGVYIISDAAIPPTLLKPRRIAFIYSTPTEQNQNAPWLKERLEFADKLFESLVKYKGESIPRLALANHLRQLLVTHNGFAWNVRLQLAVTALETFYIAPIEWQLKLYIWSPLVQQRITQICNDRGISAPTPDFFVELKELRDDATHRGGQPKSNHTKRSEIKVLKDTEKLLTETICWGILNQQLIAEVFDEDGWPP